MIDPGTELDRQSVRVELERARSIFHELSGGASTADLRRRSSGTRWTNEQLLFHMVFGYMIVRALLVLVRLFTRLPDGFSRAWASGLNFASLPFHAVNYWGSCAGALVFHGRRLEVRFDRTIAALMRQLDAESEDTLARGMHFPSRWDPLFKDWMTLLEVYHYATEHFEFHRKQLTLDQSR